MFYHHIGNRTKFEAKEICSRFGDSVHLPIPRSKEENNFYQTFFTDESLWLDISYDSSESIFKSDSGSLFAHKIFTVDGYQIVSSFDWMIFDDFDFNDVFLSSDGEWKTATESNTMTSICIFKIELDNDCSECFDKDFCQYTDKTRKNTECVCQVNRYGNSCENETECDCENGYCKSMNQSNETECICPIPFYGSKCELGNPCQNGGLSEIEKNSQASFL